MDVDIAEVRKQWLGHEFDTAEFEITQEAILDWAQTCGETEPRFLDPAHPDFQAPPTLPSKLLGRRILPQDFPTFSRRGFDAGKLVMPKAPVRAGDTLTGTSQVHDVYEKTGRSGSMVFIVHRMEFKNQDGELVCVVDWRMVQQPQRKTSE